MEKTHEFKVVKEKDMPEMFFSRALKNVGKKGLAAMIFVHGGGGIGGFGLNNQDSLNIATADNDLVVVSMNYRLAPEYKMPS